MTPETDERIRTRQGANIGVHPAYDGIRPKTRVDNRAVYDESSIGSFGTATDRITTMAQAHIAFSVNLNNVDAIERSTLVNGAGSVTGINLSIYTQNAHPLIVQLIDGRTGTALYSATLNTSDVGLRGNLSAHFGDWGMNFSSLILQTTVKGNVGTVTLNQGTISLVSTE